MFSKAKRSWVMSRIRGRNTKPEILVRRLLHAKGLRFRLERDELPGKPDIVLPRFRTAIFVHGCFWHGHSCKEGRRPKSNRSYWDKKIENNIRRDRLHRAAYKAMGWRRLVIWTCQLERPNDAHRSIEKLLKQMAA